MMRRASLWIYAGVVALAAICAGCRNHNRDIIRVAVEDLNKPQIAAQILAVPGVEGFSAGLDGDSLIMHMRVDDTCVLSSTDPQIMAEVMASTLRGDDGSRELVEALRAEGVWLVVYITGTDGATVAHAAMSPGGL